MANTEVPGDIRALLDEYKRAISQLIAVIAPLHYDQLYRLADSNTNNPDCRSIQTILTHVISSGYSYSIYIENRIGVNTERHGKEVHDNASQYIDQLHSMFEYCENIFKKNTNIIAAQTDHSKRINTSWGQQYDIEQLLEHAIVHILRHRRQIENFIKIQAGRA